MTAIEEELTLTFTNEAWEWFYGIIDQYTKENLAVEINGRECRLVRIEGDLWSGSEAQLVVSDDTLSTRSASVTETRIPLYAETGECAITRMRLL